MRSQPPDTREGASASRTIPSLSRRRDASRLASLERAFARLLARRRNERARHRLPRVPGSTLARTCSPRRRRHRQRRGDDVVSAIRIDQSWHTCTRKRERTVRVRSMTIKNKGPDRTNGKKQSARDRRRARARRDETNVCEFVRSSDARGRRPGGRTAGRARRPRWTWASAMRVVRLDRGREG